jgi:putative pyruvate formate lyase activating enzyme
MCPRGCGVDRLADERGLCGGARLASLASMGPHFGEERPLVGWGGSGTLFFSGCTLRCAFCQNAEISQLGEGRPLEARELAGAMLAVQELGCHNLNLVTPTHVTAQILEALCLAAEEGLRLPIVYNCGGYESLETLALLEGVVDIYMPDLKYMDPAMGLRYSGVPDYPQVARAALLEMQRQVGELQLDASGVAWRGLLVRHLVLPGGAAGTAEAVGFIARELSPHTYLNLMDQYRPCHRIHADPLLGRRLSAAEYQEALRLAREAGLTRLD